MAENTVTLQLTEKAYEALEAEAAHRTEADGETCTLEDQVRFYVENSLRIGDIAATVRRSPQLTGRRPLTVTLHEFDFAQLKFEASRAGTTADLLATAVVEEGIPVPDPELIDDIEEAL